MKIKFLGAGFMGAEAERVLLYLQKTGWVDLVEEDYDILLSVSYPKKISQDDIQKARFGAVNLHSGLLPKQRGYHPLNWALIWGDEKGGLTLHKLTESIDSGDIVLQKEFDIDHTDTILVLQEKAKALVGIILNEFFVTSYFPTTLDMLKNAKKQNQAQVTYAPRRYPSDSEINTEASIRDVRNLFRACHPIEYPAFVMENGRKKIVKRITIDGKLVYEE